MTPPATPETPRPSPSENPSEAASPRETFPDNTPTASEIVAPSETFSRAAFLRDSDSANAEVGATVVAANAIAPRETQSDFSNHAASTRARLGGASSPLTRDENAESADVEIARRSSFEDKVLVTETSPNHAPETSRAASREAPRVLAQRRFVQMLGTLLWPCLIVILLAYAWHPLSGDDDVWAHASIGSWIWHRQHIPRESLFLWGAPPIPWVWHSWLSQLSFYSLMRLGALFRSGGGPYAIATFTVIIVALCFALLRRNWRRHAPPGSVCAMMFFTAIFAGVLRYRPRPELFTALFLVLLMLWLDAWWREVSARATLPNEALPHAAKTARASTRSVVGRTFLLGAMFALWANFHGAVLLGLALLFATAICDLWQSRADKKSRLLLGIALLCAAATLCNPFGIGVLLDSLQSAHSGMFARIDEWKPPLPEPRLEPMIWCEIALIVMATIGWWRNPQRRLAHGVWLLMFFAMFLMQRRHLWILALVCLAVGGSNARFLDLGAAWKFCLRLLKQPATAPSPLLRLVWRATLLLGLACAAVSTLQAQRENLFPLRGVSSIPAGAAAFVNARKLRGRVFNDYENSSYFQWAWNGKNPLRPQENVRHLPSQARRALYIDLLNAYPPALLEEYLAIWKGGDAAQKILDGRDVKIIILGDDKRDRDFTKWVNRNPQWRRVYDRRGDGLVWIRVAKKAVASREYSHFPKK